MSQGHENCLILTWLRPEGMAIPGHFHPPVLEHSPSNNIKKAIASHEGEKHRLMTDRDVEDSSGLIQLL
jgi:hypothetical protein